VARPGVSSPDDPLLRQAWLAEDGARVRRPIIEADGELTLGFAADAQEKLQRLLK
jgi:arsenate reductase-like glutaredoxin family protein